MTSRTTSRVTMAVLVALVLVAAVVGWRAATAPFPKAEDQPPCVETQIAEGQEVFPDQVTVSVYNASRRNGLASRTMNGLTNRGFVAARTGNVKDTDIKGVQIWATNAKNPAVALVRAQFRNVKVTPGEALGPGVVVILGDGDVGMRKKAKTSVISPAAAEICSPLGATDDLP